MNQNRVMTILSKVSHIQSGSAFPEKFQGLVSGDLPFYKVSDMNRPENQQIMSIANNYVSYSTQQKLGINVIPKDSVIFPKVGGAIATNKKRLTGSNCCVDNNIMSVTPLKEVILPEYLMYFFQSTNLMLFANDASLPSIRKQTLESWPLPLPPLAEQQRIVARLDAAFAAIAEASAAAEANLRNARALFESYLDQVFSTRGTGWVERRLGEVAVLNYGYTESATYEKIGPQFLRITDIQENWVNWETVPFCRIEPNEFQKYQILHNDIVFARTGATTGKSYLVQNPPYAVCASYLIRLRLLEREVSAQFVYLFFQTSAYWNIIGSGVSGSAQGGFNASKLANLLIPFPIDPASQNQYVELSIKVQQNTLEVENVYKQKLAALTELKQSLLAEVFGEG